MPGFRIKVLDGNCIEATEHRLEALRQTKAGALPGKSLNVYGSGFGDDGSPASGVLDRLSADVTDRIDVVSDKTCEQRQTIQVPKA